MLKFELEDECEQMDQRVKELEVELQQSQQREAALQQQLEGLQHGLAPQPTISQLQIEGLPPAFQLHLE